VSPDFIQVEGLEMAAYGQHTLVAAANAPRLLYDGHNAEYLLQKRIFQTDAARPGRWVGALYSLMQWQKLERYEAEVCRQAQRVIACSAWDAVALRHLAVNLEPIVVPNGVDTETYRPGAVSPLDLGPQAMVFTGKMDFRPNIDAVLWFVSSVLPLLRRTAPQAHLYVVGKNPHPRLEALKGNPAVTLTGFVEDVRPYIAGADVYVAPLLTGGGTRLKVLEAMAMGKALVATTLGCEGINAAPGRDLLIADDPAPFAAQVASLFADRDRADALGSAARGFVAGHFDWCIVAAPLDAAYDA
jgi:glycosyltransferase involved in cell wall biosynthesis